MPTDNRMSSSEYRAKFIFGSSLAWPVFKKQTLNKKYFCLALALSSMETDKNAHFKFAFPSFDRLQLK